MRFAIAASALFAGLAAAAPAITQTVQATEVETITSCGPEVTNCPARSASTSAPVVPTSAPVVPTSAPVVAAVQNTTAPAQLSTVTLYSTQAVTITSCAPEVTNCPARVSSSVISVGTTVVPASEVPVSVATSAPFAMVNSTMPAQGPQGTAASTGFGASATGSMPSQYTGAAGKLNAGLTLAGVAGFAALLI